VGPGKRLTALSVNAVPDEGAGLQVARRQGLAPWAKTVVVTVHILIMLDIYLLV
jgi:hypothetical protein